IAGTTGSGKSVCMNSIIISLLYKSGPEDVKLIMVDPKMVELSVYNDSPHLLTPVITEPKKAIRAMAFIVGEMERRMAMFSKLKVRKIEDYNDKIINENLLRERMPYIMVIIDEFADLMMVAGKELENYIKRITAVARFTGIHIVLATQRPSNDVITGIIKSNMPTQIAFAVSNQINSRIIIDTNGAEKLLGRGDMLYVSAANPTPQRIQGAFIDPEIESIVNFVKNQGKPDYIDDCFLEEEDDEDSAETSVSGSDGGGDLFDRAWRILAAKGEASASYLQRKMSIGYNRAATLIEQLEEAGYIGPARGSKPREILRFPEDEK
ncbi:MAG: DNA translocase FtsK, partial [Sphaerochaetaceae bacterium]|nr:DNA translocase FtsK [Sphaerochaetaceae bacterium]